MHGTSPATSRGTDFPVYRFIPGVSRGEGLFMAILKKEGEWEAGFFSQGEQEG